MDIQNQFRCEKYYTYADALKTRFTGKARKMALNAATQAEYLEWKQALREKISELIGLDKFEYTEAEPTQISVEQLDGYRREKWLIQTEPGVIMPLYILIPDKLPAGIKNKVIIAPHGHGSAGKYTVAGRYDIPFVNEAIKEYNYDYGVAFVKRGYTVFCPDARGFGERRESNSQGNGKDEWLRQSCFQLNHMGLPFGVTATGMWIWDLMRLIDYIKTRPDCDAAHIACCGLSGGGMQTLYLTALDERIKCGVDSGYFYGVYESLFELTQMCSCNYVPYLWETCDMGDIGALIAPRPFMVESGKRDPLNGKSGLANVKSQLDIARHAYELFNAGDKLVWNVFDGPHMWSGINSYEFVEANI